MNNKNKILKPILILISVFINIVFLSFLWSFYSNYYLGNSEKDSYDRVIYQNILLQKIKKDFFKNYNDFSREVFPDSEKTTSGEFCRNLSEQEINSGILYPDIKEGFLSGEIVSGGVIYPAEINLGTEELEINYDVEEIWHWKWYNWFGIGVDKITSKTVEEIMQ